MLHVFLDSNIFFTDPFMDKNIHNKLLIELAEKELITIYVSDVVKQEVINNFEKELVKYFDEIKKNENKITKMLRTNDNPPIEWKETVEEYVTKLKDHFDDQEFYCIMKVIPMNNEILPELVHRSIKRIKPFTERKMEFRDAIIWFSYVEFIKKENITPAYFITKNTDDFTLNGEIHPDLLEDSTDFIFYKTPQDFIQNCEPVKHLQKALELLTWVENEDFPNYPDQIVDLVGGKWFDKVYEACAQYVYDRPDRIPTGYFYDADYLEPHDMQLETAGGINVEVILDTIIVTGYLTTHVYFDISKYNPVYEPGDDEYIHLGSGEVALSVDFTMTINQNKKIEGLDITDISRL